MHSDYRAPVMSIEIEEDLGVNELRIYACNLALVLFTLASCIVGEGSSTKELQVRILKATVVKRS